MERVSLGSFIQGLLAPLFAFLLVPALGVRGMAQTLEGTKTEPVSQAESRLTMDQAIEEAIQNNLNLLAERLISALLTPG